MNYRAVIAKLEKAEMTMCAPDARSVIRDERVGIMAAWQRGVRGETMQARLAEGMRVLAMWQGVAS